MPKCIHSVNDKGITRTHAMSHSGVLPEDSMSVSFDSDYSLQGFILKSAFLSYC